MAKKRSKKGGKSKKGRKASSKRRSRDSGRSSKGTKSSSGSSSSSGGGAMMSLRGGFKGAVGSVTGKKPKTKRGSIISNIIWTVLTIAALALLAYKICQWV